MNGINRRSVRVDLKDVYGNRIHDRVVLTFHNQRASSLDLKFTVNFQGAPEDLPGVPAFPFGLAQVIIQPKIYRFKSIFADIPAGDDVVDLFNATDRADYTFFVDPHHAAPSFPSFAQLQQRFPDLMAVLQNPAASSAGQWFTADWWNRSDNNPAKAGLLNLYAKMKHTQFPDGTTVFARVQQIWQVLPARLWAIVGKELHDLAQSSTGLFHSVSGALHDFRPGWHLLDSYKTFDPAGNLQLTFATDDSKEFLNQGKLMSDTDVDDHQGIEHAFDVIQHTLTSTDSNPYDIHEILTFFQGIDPGYKLI